MNKVEKVVAMIFCAPFVLVCFIIILMINLIPTIARIFRFSLRKSIRIFRSGDVMLGLEDYLPDYEFGNFKPAERIKKKKLTK